MSGLANAMFICNAVEVGLSIVSFFLGIAKYVFLRQLRKRANILSFDDLNCIDSIDRSLNDRKFYGETLSPEEARADIDCIHPRHPMAGTMSIASFGCLWKPTNCPRWLDRLHIWWQVLAMAFYFVIQIMEEYIRLFRPDLAASGADPASSTKPSAAGGALSSSNLVLVFVLDIVVWSISLYIYYFFASFARSPRFLRLIHHASESQVAEQREYEENMRLSFNMLYGVMSVLALITVAYCIYDAAVSTSAYFQYPLLGNLAAWLFFAVMLISYTVAASVSICLNSEASMLSAAMRPVRETMQAMIDDASLSDHTHAVSVELNPLFKHKHRHKFKPLETKLTEVLGGFNAGAAFHTYVVTVDKVRFASRVLSPGLFAMIPLMILFYAAILLTWIGLSSFYLGAVFSLGIQFSVYVGPPAMCFVLYAQISAVLVDTKQVLINTLSMYGLIVDTSRSSVQQQQQQQQQQPQAGSSAGQVKGVGNLGGQDVRQAVLTEAMIHLPDFYSIAGIPFDSAGLVKIGSLLVAVSGVVSVFAGSA